MKICTVILHPKRPLRVQRHQNRMTGMRETSPNLAQKWPKTVIFRFSQKLHTIRTKFSTVILHQIMVLYVHFH